MTAFARLDVTPVKDGSMAEEIADAVAALDEFDVSYETTPMDTVIEGDSVGEVFAAARAAHEAVSTDRVVTSLEVDDQRGREQHSTERIAAVERELGHPPENTAD